MLAQVYSSAVLGIDAYVVEVEVDITAGAPGFTIVGLPDTAVQESKERVRAAIKNSGLSFPTYRITVNLAPADVRKEGPSFDLPIALGVLAATGQIPMPGLEEILAVGELSLDGDLRPVTGVLPMAITAKAEGKRAVLVPADNAREAGVVKGLTVYAATNLLEAVQAVCGDLAPYEPEPVDDELAQPDYGIDFGDVKGQESVKRALEVAAAGGHNVIMVGPPGSGKTMLARRFPTLLPPLSLEEALEVTKLYSVAGLMDGRSSLITRRAFRAPHHTVSNAGLVGGGSIPKPGEISLAHLGVLFLDELPEFSRTALEVLRQPLEDGIVSIARATASLTYPARFSLIASMNPCPCGYYGDSMKQCSCTPQQIKKYLMRISGPLLDRIDIHLEVPRLRPEELLSQPTGESSTTIRSRVTNARRIQQERFEGTHIFCNAHMTSRQIRQYCNPSDEVREMLRSAINHLGLSARAYDRILKLSRTIADLSGSADIAIPHVAEAIQYRALDRKLWG